MIMKKEYSNGEVTIVWQPKMCIHSEKCFRGLPSVFKPKEKPWIQPEGATTEQIIDQVKSCPSGALSYYMNGSQTDDQKEEATSNMKVQVTKNGPLMVSGGVTIELSDGSMETKQTAAFCRCGHSNNKPYCDGSHKREGFEG